jgi:hypothetical protein
MGGEWEGDVFHIEEWLAFDELQHQLVVSGHEGLVGCHIDVSHSSRSLVMSQ